jgi:pyrroline-5-carboxylate reductase
MLKEMNLAFIGSGTMAEAMIKVILDKALMPPKQIIGSGPREERGQELHDRYGIEVTTNNQEAARTADIVVLSVKPQVLPKVLTELRGCIMPNALVLSIVAGRTMSTIAAGLEHAAIVRAMPNTPAQIGEGMTIWTPSPGVSERQQAQAQAILRAMGQEIYVSEERALDMATAVSGTGPTYVFLMMEAMTDAAVHLGFSRRVAKALVIQTVLGSALFAGQSQKHLAELRNMVTSPGGTSADAIYQLEKGSLRTILSKAIWAAYQKSILLGEKNSISSPERTLPPEES